MLTVLQMHDASALQTLQGATCHLHSGRSAREAQEVIREAEAKDPFRLSYLETSDVHEGPVTVWVVDVGAVWRDIYVSSGRTVVFVPPFCSVSYVLTSLCSVLYCPYLRPPDGLA